MRGLHGWVRLLERNQTAVLASLIRELDRITASDESSATQLAQAILKDASLTTNILRVANSVQFNQSEIPVTTVSRAILNIGFKHIRAICLSLKVLETVLNESPSELLLASLAKSLHAAIQARNLCQNLPQTRQEEVFVATLLMELVPLLVLASPEEDAKALTQQLTLTATDEERNRQAEKLLGVSFSRLSRTLLKQWRIEGIVHEALLAPEEPGVQVRSVLLGAEISRTSLFGWDSPEFQDTLKRVGEFKVLSPEQTSKLLQTSADEAVQMVTSLGKAQMGRMIATRKRAAEWQASGAPESERKPLLEPNLSLQMRALQELSTTMTGDFNINQVFKLVLTGLQRGIGLERVVFALFSKSDLSFACKHVLGEGGERLKEAFVLRYVKSHQGFLHNLFEQDAGVWIDRQGRELLSRFLDGSIKGVTGADEFLIAPLSAKGRKVGLLYADMKVSDRALTAEQFQGFGMFLQQVRLALGILASRQETT